METCNSAANLKKQWNTGLLLGCLLEGKCKLENTGYTSKYVTKPRNDFCDCKKNNNVYNRKVTVNSVSGRSLRFVADKQLSD